MIENSQPLFETTRTAILVVDAGCRVLSINRAARELLCYPSEQPDPGLTCHSLLCRQDTPCRECLLSSSPSSGLKSHALSDVNGRERFIKEDFLRLPEYTVLTLFDVTREITALRQLDLTRKELKAKAVMLEQRRREITDEKDRIIGMLNQLPEALVLVDGDHRVLKKNSAVREMLPQMEGATCFELMGKEAVCSGCPAEKGFGQGGDLRISHHVKGRYLTEYLVSSSGENEGLLLFRDTTRQIQLIEKIREQQDTITRKNDILSSLVGLQTKFQNAAVPNDVMAYFLDVFLPLVHVEAAVVIADDIRPGSIWQMLHRGIEPAEVTRIARGYLSREIQSGKSRTILREFLPWKETCQVDLIGGNGRRVGMVLFPETERGIENSLIQLFSEPFGAFIHNRLLLRQLEEKANTDPLTGLFNRRFMDEALVSERKKSDEFGIPYAVIMVDINRLKQANDLYGHEVGDRLILAVSERLKSVVRNTDFISRIGGDEFLILLADTTDDGALRMSERLTRGVFAETTIEAGSGELFPVTVSLGHAGSDQVPHDAMMVTADKRMYAGKEAYYQIHSRYR